MHHVSSKNCGWRRLHEVACPDVDREGWRAAGLRQGLLMEGGEGAENGAVGISSCLQEKIQCVMRMPLFS